VFIAALFTMTGIWKQPKCPPIDEQLKTMWHMYIHTHGGILLSYKKEWNLAIRDNLDGPTGYYAK